MTEQEKYPPGGRQILAVDFDGTVVTHDFPTVGEPMPHAIRVLKRLQEMGHHIVLWTCREDELGDPRRNYLTQAVEFMEAQGIKLRSVNENLPSDEFRNPVGLRRKAYAKVYLDDRSIDTMRHESADKPHGVCWLRWETWFEENGWL